MPDEALVRERLSPSKVNGWGESVVEPDHIALAAFDRILARLTLAEDVCEATRRWTERCLVNHAKIAVLIQHSTPNDPSVARCEDCVEYDICTPRHTLDRWEATR